MSTETLWALWPLVSMPALVSYLALPLLWTRPQLRLWVKATATLLLLGRIGLSVAQQLITRTFDSYDMVLVSFVGFGVLHTAVLLALVALSLTPRAAS